LRIAVVGAGIAGMGCAYLLSREHEVVLFEAEDRLGGHTHTHRVRLPSGDYAVDTGFIVFNPEHYPLLTRLFGEIAVASKPTLMSFSVQNAASGLEYNASSIAGLFCRRRNLVSPYFWRLLRDIARFYREAPALLQSDATGPTLGDYLDANGYSAGFRDDHLVPMACALWSSASVEIMRFPARYLVQFMANHQMLDLGERKPWRVVEGGSSSYIRALEARWPVQVRLGQRVRGIRRGEQQVEVRSEAGSEPFDQIVLACHSDQALALLDDASEREHDVLGALRYQPNDTVLHTDARLLPRRRRAWAAWNAYVPATAAEHCTVSYCMNILQSLPAPEPLVVTLNRSEAIDPDKVLARMRYHHPLYSHASVAAQARRGEVNGHRRTWFAGAYWGWGFHEDGLRSAVEVAKGLGVDWR